MITLHVRQSLRSIVHKLISAELPRHDHSFIACSRHMYVCMVLFFTHISFMVNHTTNATPPERLQQYPKQKTFTNYHAQFPLHNKQLCPWEISSLDDPWSFAVSHFLMHFINRCNWQRCTGTGVWSRLRAES